MTPIKTNLLLSVSFFLCATARADRCTSGTNSLCATARADRCTSGTNSLSSVGNKHLIFLSF